MKELGYQIIALSPDRPEKVAGVLKGAKAVDYTLLSDAKMEAAQSFGIAWTVDPKMVGQLKQYGIDLEEASGETHNLLPVPAIFVVSAEGKVEFAYANPDYRVRLAPAVLLAAAKDAVD